MYGERASRRPEPAEVGAVIVIVVELVVVEALDVGGVAECRRAAAVRRRKRDLLRRSLARYQQQHSRDFVPISAGLKSRSETEMLVSVLVSSISSLSQSRSKCKTFRLGIEAKILVSISVLRIWSESQCSLETEMLVLVLVLTISFLSQSRSEGQTFPFGFNSETMVSSRPGNQTFALGRSRSKNVGVDHSRS